MVWAAVLGVFLQLWINFEVGRWTIATGETVYTGYSRVWRGFAPLFILITMLSWIAPGWGRAIFSETEENQRRFQAWWNYIKKDQILFFWALNTVTILLFIVCALSVLQPKGIFPNKGTLYLG